VRLGSGVAAGRFWQQLYGEALASSSPESEP